MQVHYVDTVWHYAPDSKNVWRNRSESHVEKHRERSFGAPLGPFGIHWAPLWVLLYLLGMLWGSRIFLGSLESSGAVSRILWGSLGKPSGVLWGSFGPLGFLWGPRGTKWEINETESNWDQVGTKWGQVKAKWDVGDKLDQVGTK